MEAGMADSTVDILLVEDNISDAELSLYTMKKYKIANRIHHARDGAEALEFIFGSEKKFESPPVQIPRLILLDLKLPKIDGQEVLRKIKSNEASKSIPIVVLTSSHEERDILESYKLGVNSYVVKPIDFDKFTETVKQVGLYWLELNLGTVIGR
jgi:two-component system, response regulator